jgi:membrane protease YdiL (CAAX protease family)
MWDRTTVLVVAIMYLAWAKFLFADETVYVLDYIFRIACLIVLFRAFEWREVLAWPERRWRAVLLTVLMIYLLIAAQQARHLAESFHPELFIAQFPYLEYGPLKMFDLTVGLALVAASEEMVFRYAFARAWLQRGGGVGGLYLVSSLAFGLLHAPQGVSAVVDAFVAGLIFMFFYRRIGLLWPPMLAHYLVNFLIFSGHGCPYGMGGCRPNLM